MKKENVKIGMMVELTEDYGQLQKGTVYKVLRAQFEGGECFVVEHDGLSSYLDPYCGNFKPYKKLKKHELLKKAYDNYPKGTKFIGAGGEEFVSSGCFNIVYGNILKDNYGLVYDVDADKWAEIIKEPKEIKVPLYFMNQTAVVKTNSEVHILDGYGHIDATLSFGDIVDIQNEINKLK